MTGLSASLAKPRMLSASQIRVICCHASGIAPLAVAPFSPKPDKGRGSIRRGYHGTAGHVSYSVKMVEEKMLFAIYASKKKTPAFLGRGLSIE